MARSLKTRGMQELDSLRRRVKRQYALGRITKTDHDQIIDRLNNVEAIIVSMRETNEQGEEETADAE